MMHKPRCIFHLPFKPDPVGRPSGTNVRPSKMLQGFRDAGFEVLELIGSSDERKRALREARSLIESGIEFEFIYSESETMPTALTDPDHFPRHPFMDFSFFRWCRKRGIPVGLFLRDAHWRSEEYAKVRAGLKGAISSALHWYDLKQYERSIDVLFVPSSEFTVLLGSHLRDKPKVPLPSAADSLMGESGVSSALPREDGVLRLGYVGGISVGEAYDLTALLQAVSRMEGVALSLCVREREWEQVRGHYEAFLGSNIDVLHVQGAALREVLASCDVGMLFYPTTQYRVLSMPTKVFEYLESGLPIIATRNTAAGSFVDNCNCGWSIDFSVDELMCLLGDLRDRRQLVSEKKNECLSVAQSNTWVRRAEEVASVLGALK